MRDLETNSDMLKQGRDPDGYCFYFFISTFNFLITANILKFRHELPESNINSALSSKAAIKGPIVSDFAVNVEGVRDKQPLLDVTAQIVANRRPQCSRI